MHYIDCDRRLDEWISVSKATLADSNSLRSELVSPISLPSDALTSNGDPQKLTRRLKRRIEEVHHVHQVEDLSPIDQTLEREHHERTKVKNINVRLHHFVLTFTRL